MRKLKIVSKSSQSLSIPNNVVLCSESILGAFEAVILVAHKSELDEEKLKEADDVFNFLQTKLNLTTFQVLLLAMLIDSMAPLQPRQMANFLGISNIRMLSLLSQLQELVDRHLVRAYKSRSEKAIVYEIRQEVIHVYMQNKATVPNANARLTLPKLFERLQQLYDQCDDGEMEIEELEKEVKEIVKKNQRYQVCKWMKDNDSMNQLLFLYLCTCYVLEGDQDINPFQLRNYFSPLRFRNLCNQLTVNTHPLMEAGLIIHAVDAGFSSRENVTVSEEVRKYLALEMNLEWEMRDSMVDKSGLRICDEIQQKELFFNETEDKAVSRLSSLLQEENYQGIRERLSVCGMRKGLACLLYGAPGTGKTETVYQLAKATGRDVMPVNISQIKSKWVGDTEKNIKNIFERYRNYCKKCDRAPILLFNEADAIISNRNGKAVSSVDKMENAMQNIILEELEQLDGILIATTNLTSAMDPAFERRFIYKIEFHKPQPSVKVAIWQSMLKDLSREDAEVLSGKYDFTGGQIENIVRKQVIDSILYNRSMSLQNLEEYCQMEQIHKENAHRSVVGFR